MAAQPSAERAGALLKTPLCGTFLSLKAFHIMLEQEWEMPCLRLPVVRAKNDPISSRTGLAWAQSALGHERGHGAGAAPPAHGHSASSSSSGFIFNPATQSDGERKRRVLPWVEVQRALFSHYGHCVAIMDNYNLASHFFFFFENHTKALKPETSW